MAVRWLKLTLIWEARFPHKIRPGHAAKLPANFLGVAQLGQSVRFGTGKSVVRIHPPRPVSAGGVESRHAAHGLKRCDTGGPCGWKVASRLAPGPADAVQFTAAASAERYAVVIRCRSSVAEHLPCKERAAGSIPCRQHQVSIAGRPKPALAPAGLPVIGGEAKHRPAGVAASNRMAQT